jgi:hypothetical protein
MNAPLARPIDGQALDAIDTRSPAEIFAGHCEARALRVVEGILSLHEAVDELQGYAKLSGLIDRIGQDAVQETMGIAFMAAEMAPDELAIEREIFLGAGDLVRRWELADPRDRWKWTGEPPPTNGVSETPLPARTRSYRTPQSTIDAFFFVVRTKDAAGIAEWLARHPRDEQHLYKLWKQKCSTT